MMNEENYKALMNLGNIENTFIDICQHMQQNIPEWNHFLVDDPFNLIIDNYSYSSSILKTPFKK